MLITSSPIENVLRLLSLRYLGILEESADEEAAPQNEQDEESENDGGGETGGDENDEEEPSSGSTGHRGSFPKSSGGKGNNSNSGDENDAGEDNPRTKPADAFAAAAGGIAEGAIGGAIARKTMTTKKKVQIKIKSKKKKKEKKEKKRKRNVTAQMTINNQQTILNTMMGQKVQGTEMMNLQRTITKILNKIRKNTIKLMPRKPVILPLVLIIIYGNEIA